MADVLYLIRYSPEPAAEKARALAALAWEPPARLLTSPRPSALPTARALAAAWELEIEEDPDLAEDERENENGRDRVPDSSARARERCLELPETAVACVTHGGILSAWCCSFLGLDTEERCVFAPEPSTLTAFVRKQDGSGWELAFFNNKPST